MAVATRRGMFGLLALAALAVPGTAGCSALGVQDDQARQRQTDSAARTRAAAAARALAALYPPAAAAGYVNAVTAQQFRMHHEAHIVRLGATTGPAVSPSATMIAGPSNANQAAGPVPSFPVTVEAGTTAAFSTPQPTGVGSMAAVLPAAQSTGSAGYSGSAAPDPVSSAAAANTATLTASELTAAHTAVADTIRTSAPLAQLLASISACRALHATVLEPQDPMESAAPAIAISGGASIGAAQSALAAENAVIYAFGALGAQLPKNAQEQAHAALDLHRDQRDLLEAAISTHGSAPVAAAAAYRLPFAVTDQASAAKLAALVETRLAAAYADAVRTASAPDRAYAAWALTGATIRAHAWGQPVPAFPGLS